MGNTVRTRTAYSLQVADETVKPINCEHTAEQLIAHSSLDNILQTSDIRRYQGLLERTSYIFYVRALKQEKRPLFLSLPPLCAFLSVRPISSLGRSNTVLRTLRTSSTKRYNLCELEGVRDRFIGRASDDVSKVLRVGGMHIILLSNTSWILLLHFTRSYRSSTTWYALLLIFGRTCRSSHTSILPLRSLSKARNASLHPSISSCVRTMPWRPRAIGGQSRVSKRV